MGFLSALGKIASVAAPIAAIPFTGGASAAMLPSILGAAGTAAGAIGAGMAGERTNENTAIQNQNQLLASLYGTKQSAMNQLLALAESGALNRAKLGIEAPQARTSQLIRGSLLANLQPAKIQVSSRLAGRVPQLSGGLTPAALSSAARAGGAELQRQALLALLSGSDVPAMPDYSKGLLASPELGQYKQASGLESALGLGGAVASGVGNILNAKTPPILAAKPTATQYAGLRPPVRATGV